MKTLTRLIVPLLLGALAACDKPDLGQVTLTPPEVTLAAGGSVTFNASVAGSNAPKVLWSVEGEGEELPGTITSSGLYTAPLRAGTYHVVATNVEDSSKKATATVIVPVSQGGGYTNPQGTGWRLVKNTTASSGNHLVLDLLGPPDESGRGVSLTLSTDANRARWAKVSASDAEYVSNGLFALGDEPRLLKGLVQDGMLRVGVFQKGSSAPATAYTGALLSVALEVKLDNPLPAGTRIPLSALKAQVVGESGEVRDVDVAVGLLTAE